MNAVVYRHFGESGELLYVGCSSNIGLRTSAHVNSSAWFHKVRTITLEFKESREAAFAAEKEAIQKELPIYNLTSSIFNRRKYPPRLVFPDEVKEMYSLDLKRFKKLSPEIIKQISESILPPREASNTFHLPNTIIQFIRGYEKECEIMKLEHAKKTDAYLLSQEKKARQEMMEDYFARQVR